MALTDDQSQYVAYLLELMQSIGEVYARPMFGGHGVFLDKLMFALIADGVLYLKADAESRVVFEQRHLQAFSYMKKGKAFNLSYFQAPDDALEDPDEMAQWAQQAYTVALKANVKKPGQ